MKSQNKRRKPLVVNLAKCPDILTKLLELERVVGISPSRLVVECLRRGLRKK